MPEGLTPRQRRNYVLLLLATGLYFCGISFMLLLPKFLSELGASESQLGLLVGVPLLPFLLLSPLVGSLADRVSARRLALFGIGVAVLSGVALLWVDEVSALVYLLRIAHGAGHAFTFTAIFSMVAKALSSEQKAQGLAYFTVVIQLGNVAGSLLGSLIVQQGAYEFFFAASAGFIAVAWALCWLVEEFGASGTTGAAVTGAGGYRELLGRRGLGSGLLLILLLGGAFGTVLQFVPIYLDALFAMGLAVARIPSFWFLTSTLATVALVRVVFGGKLYRPGREPLLTLCMIGLPLAILLLELIRGPATAVLAAVAFGVTYGLLFPAINALVLVRAGATHQGKASGLLAMVFEMGFRGFGFAMGPLAEAFGYFSMFYVLAALLGAGVVTFLALENDRERWLMPARAAAES